MNDDSVVGIAKELKEWIDDGGHVIYLVRGANSAKTINVRKPVAVAGTASGNLSIRIDGAAKIYAKRSEVASLLEGKSDKSERVRTASGEDFVSFEQLRDMGVDIRYDPSADRIVIPNAG